MRFGKQREAVLALCAAVGLGMSLSASVRADGYRLRHTLPREVPAVDLNTGGEFFAPRVPFGHYAKDPMGYLANGVGRVKGSLLGLGSHFGDKLHGLGQGGVCGLCGKLHGLGSGCGGAGGGCLGSHSGLGHCGGGGAGCGFCSGLGLFHKHGAGCGSGCGGGVTAAVDPCAGGRHKKSFAPYHPVGAMATGQTLASGQAVVVPTAQNVCGQPGCGLGGLHSHLENLKNKLRCKLCGGGGCGPCGGSGFGDPCGSCGGSGHGLRGLCGSCGGCGLLAGLGRGLGHGRGTGCPNCGGAGCAQCLKGLAGLGGKLHGLLTAPLGMLHQPKMEYFMGPGGPVPLTPGYVPYIVTTRSPRDFFAFPPMNPDAP